jgi:hypothetical protein
MSPLKIGKVLLLIFVPQCQQLTAEMNVAYTNTTRMLNSSETEMVVHKRNILVGIGCACVQSQPQRMDEFIKMMVEKRDGNSDDGPGHQSPAHPYNQKNRLIDTNI